MREFIGHSSIIEAFKKRITNNNLSHAHLIVGSDGIGKSILADIFAKEIMGGNLNREYIDIIKYRSGKASFGVEDVRKIIEEVNKKPFEGNKKVIILYDANKLTVQAQNALLKTIEEPPNGVFIILLTDSAEVLLDTIKSRCQIFKLFPLNKNEIDNYVDTNYETLLEDVKKSALAYSEGIPGKVDMFIKEESLQEIRYEALSLLKDLSKFNNTKVLEYEQKISKFKKNSDDFFNILISYVRDILLNKTSDSKKFLINIDKYSEIDEITNDISYKKLNIVLEKVEEARRALVSNINFDTTIRIMLINFMEG